MAALELSGQSLAKAIRVDVTRRAAALAAAGAPVSLAVVHASDDDSSAWYVRSIARAAEQTGIACDVIDLGPAATGPQIAETLARLSVDEAVAGIIRQTPLPDGVDHGGVASGIDPRKDVDGANATSLGRLASGQRAFAPATAAAVMRLLDHHEIVAAGRHAIVVGRSLVVGRPVAQLLLQRDATVTTCHSRTIDLRSHTRRADILVVAVGRAAMIGPDDVTSDAVVIDVGTNPTPDGGLEGDVDPAVAAVAAALSPVPGGVGPVTTALLLQQTVEAAELALSRAAP